MPNFSQYGLDKSDALWKPSHEKALLAIKEALKQQPNDPKLLLWRAKLFDELERKEEQRDALAELLHKHPAFLPGLIESNFLTHDDKKYEESLRFARELAKKHADNAEVLVHHSSLLFKEISRRLYLLFPNKVIDSSGNAFNGLHKEYDDLLAIRLFRHLGIIGLCQSNNNNNRQPVSLHGATSDRLGNIMCHTAVMRRRQGQLDCLRSP